MSTPRTVLVAKVSAVFSKFSRKVLVLVSVRDYAFYLGKYLANEGVTRFGISFGSGTGYIYNGLDPSGEPVYDYISSSDVIDMLNRGEISVVIGTSHVDEGCDIKGLDCLILSCGGKKDRRVIQRVGRVLRRSKNGKYAYIVDFTDEGNYILQRQSGQRLSMYTDTIGIPDSNIYNDVSINTLYTKFLELEDLNNKE